MNLQWEKIGGAPSLLRTAIPTGWLVTPGLGTPPVFVEDPGHTWGTTAKPTPHSDDVFIDFQCAVGDEDTLFKIQSDGDTATLVEISGGDRSNALGNEDHTTSHNVMTPEVALKMAEALIHVAHQLQEEASHAK